MPSSVRRLTIERLHDRQDVNIDFNQDVSIFMGPNGVGKSTVLNIFVHFLSRQWQRLAKQPFSRATIEFTSGEIASITKNDCQELISSDLPPRIQQMASIISEAGLLDAIFNTDTSRDIEFTQISSATGLTPRDIRLVRSHLIQYSDSIRVMDAISNATRTIQDNFNRSILYLPTYRRIEQEITEVLSLGPSSMRRIQAEIADSIAHGSVGYTELVRFGMDDIRELIDNYTSDIKEYSRQQINSLSTRYLTAALRSRQTFERNFFDSLSDARIKDVLARVDDEELNASQRKSLTDLIKSLRNRQGSGRLTRAQEHIASFFHMLAETHERISRREVSLRRLANILNLYIGPSKHASYDETRYEFVIKCEGIDIPLSGLSSGEKQLVSLFSTLALSEDNEYFVVIDEPELSLSVLWQERLLKDIHSLDSCMDLLAVTHSPFIYGESFAKNTRDLGDFITRAEYK